MDRYELTIAAFVCTFGLGACATVGTQFSNGMLTDQGGMTLYTFDKDAPNSGKSVCNGQCAANWPPYTASAEDKPGGYWSIATRDDGSRQWTFKGRPVYRWSKDKKPGDMTGEGFANIWHVIRDDRPDERMAGGGY